jgi:hypothetical protein
MAQGKQLGEWSCKFTSFTLTPGPAGSIVTQGNYEGPSTGEVAGTLIGTATFVGGKSGTFSICVSLFLDDGNELSATGSGTYESSGKHHWLTQGVGQISDGRTITFPGELDLATRSWKGKTFEQS